MTVKITLDTASVQQLVIGLRRKQLVVQDAAKEAIQSVGSKIFDEAQARVPVQTGALQRSGRFTAAGSKEAPEGIISYGDMGVGRRGRTTAEYAVERHEQRSRSSDLRAGDKWLEKALLENGEAFRNEVLRLMRAALSK